MSTLNRDCCCNYKDWHRGDLIRCKYRVIVYEDVHQDNPRWEVKDTVGFVLAHGKYCDECFSDESYLCKWQTQVLLGRGIVYVDDVDWVKVDD